MSIPYSYPALSTKIKTGEIVPSNKMGDSNDLYFQRNGVVWTKESGTWKEVNSSSIQKGTVLPTTGNEGDLFVDTTSGVVRVRHNGTWIAISGNSSGPEYKTATYLYEPISPGIGGGVANVTYLTHADNDQEDNFMHIRFTKIGNVLTMYFVGHHRVNAGGGSWWNPNIGMFRPTTPIDADFIPNITSSECSIGALYEESTAPFTNRHRTLRVYLYSSGNFGISSANDGESFATTLTSADQFRIRPTVATFAL